MSNGLLVQDLARLTQSSLHTLRYYERIGLIGEGRAAEGTQRHYTPNDVSWLRFLLNLRATGMSVTRMLKFADLKRQGDRTISARRQLLENHAAAVTEQIRALDTELQDILARIKLCRSLERSYLQSEAATHRKRRPAVARRSASDVT